MKKDFTRDNVSWVIRSSFFGKGYNLIFGKQLTKVKKHLLKGINELLIHKKEHLIPKKDITILNQKIIEFCDANLTNLEREEFNETLTNFIMAYYQAIIREQNIINILYK